MERTKEVIRAEMAAAMRDMRAAGAAGDGDAFYNARAFRDARRDELVKLSEAKQ